MTSTVTLTLDRVRELAKLERGSELFMSELKSVTTLEKQRDLCEEFLNSATLFSIKTPIQIFLDTAILPTLKKRALKKEAVSQTPAPTAPTMKVPVPTVTSAPAVPMDVEQEVDVKKTKKTQKRSSAEMEKAQKPKRRQLTEDERKLKFEVEKRRFDKRRKKEAEESNKDLQLPDGDVFEFDERVDLDKLMFLETFVVSAKDLASKQHVNGYIRRKYARQKKSKHGRIYPVSDDVCAQLCIQTCEFRKFLFGGNYWDIDIVNSGATWLYQFCIRDLEFDDRDLTHIKDYLDRRDEVLQQAMDDLSCDKEMAKKMFIVILNGGKWWTPANTKTAKIVNGIIDEIANILPKVKVYYDTKCPDRIESELESMPENGNKRDKNFDIEKSVIFRVYERFESKMLLAMLNKLGTYKDELGIDRTECGGPIHDGLPLSKLGKYKTQEDVDALLPVLESEILRRTGYVMKLKIKSLEMTPEVRKEILSTPFHLEVNVQKVATHFLQLKRLEFGEDRFVRTPEGKFRLFDASQNRWMLDGEIADQVLSNEINKHSGYIAVQWKCHLESIIKAIKKSAPKNNFTDNSVDRLPFLDGWYDATLNKKGGDSNILLNCVGVIPWKLSDVLASTDEDVEYVKNNYVFIGFNKKSKHHAEFWLRTKAWGVVRCRFIKGALIICGPADAGKSKICRLDTVALGSFHCVIDNNHLMERKGKEYEAVDRGNSWMLKIEGKRLTTANDMNSDMTFSRDVLRNRFDAVSYTDGRAAFGREQNDVKVETIWQLMCNSVPKCPVDPSNSTITRMNVINMNRQPLDVPTDADIPNHDEYFRKRPKAEIDAEVANPTYIKAYLKLLLNYSQLPQMVDAPQDLKEDSRKIVDSNVISRAIDNNRIRIWGKDDMKTWETLKNAKKPEDLAIKTVFLKLWFCPSNDIQKRVVGDSYEDRQIKSEDVITVIKNKYASQGVQTGVRIAREGKTQQRGVLGIREVPPAEKRMLDEAQDKFVDK